MWLKRGSLAALFVLLISLVYTLDIKDKFSASFDILLPESSSKDALLIYQTIEHGQYVVLAAKDTAQIVKQIEQLQGYEKLSNKQSLDFLEEYRFYTANIPKTLPNYEQIKENLTNFKKELLEGFTFQIDKNDPLFLFKETKKTATLPSIEGFETSVIFKLNISPNEYEKYYDALFDIVKDKNVFIFSPFFYHVENAKTFSLQVKIILSLSAVILALLYLYWLRKPALLISVILTLLSAAAFSQIVASFIWSEISLYSLIFSAAASTISIDYMFHYYVLGLYNRPSFSKSVFLGFFTTFASFIALSLVNFTLISQIALTSAAALMFSYVSFAFIYPHLGFGEAKSNKFKFNGKKILNPFFVCGGSLIIIILSPIWLDPNYDIKALDIKNPSLDAKADMLNYANQSAILLKADSLDELIQKAKKLQKQGAVLGAASLLSESEYQQKLSSMRELDFISLKNNINAIAPLLGFKKGYFDDAYATALLYPKAPFYEKEFLRSRQIMQIEDKFYASGYYGGLIEEGDITVINSAHLFEKELLQIEEEIILSGVFIAVLIILTIFFAARKDALKAFSFVLAPLALCFCIFIFTKITIIHIFMLIIVAAMSVDYGIYSVSEGGKKVKEAIYYSLLSTIAGFGVLAVSSIASMRAIGITALCACFMIMILLYFMETKNEIDT
ncbi:MAG: hypothetical protein LBS26_05430 [Campylobacteraceae bacterium]|jgi:hypothetical protein|nr:hypothetical protein [Campylobacteraceae bacterium]